jgi:LysM repeat protein
MLSIQSFSILLVFPGTLFMLASLVMCTGMRRGVPDILRAKWSAMTYLILFFMGSYIAFLVIQLMDLAFPLELVTSTVFFGGSIFVFLVMRLTSVTIRKFRESESQISEVNQVLIVKNTQLEEEISARKKAEDEARTRLQYLSTLHAIDLVITSNLDLKVTMTVFLEQIVPRFQIDAAALLLLNSHTQTLEYGAGIGFKTNAIEDALIRVGAGPAGTAALKRRIVQIDDMENP